MAYYDRWQAPKKRYQVYSIVGSDNPLFIDSFDDPVQAAALIDRMKARMALYDLLPVQYRLEMVDAAA